MKYYKILFIVTISILVINITSMQQNSKDMQEKNRLKNTFNTLRDIEQEKSTSEKAFINGIAEVIDIIEAIRHKEGAFIPSIMFHVNYDLLCTFLSNLKIDVSKKEKTYQQVQEILKHEDFYKKLILMIKPDTNHQVLWDNLFAFVQKNF